MNAALLLLATLTVFHVDPWHHKPFLPDADPGQGVVTETIPFAAAQGEIEAVSFIVRPDADYPQVDVVPSDLKGPGNAKIPASAADVTSVKVWFRPAGRWISSWAAGQTRPEPINNLVLHDDALVHVDWSNKVNYVRGIYSDGPYYMDMSHRDLKTHLNNDLEPIYDAPKFVPFDLKRDFRQQYLVTWKIPKDAKPGDYTGRIALVSHPKGRGERVLKTLTLRLEVYPFALPRPRTHYDTSLPYYSYWMGSPSIDRLLVEGHDLARAEKKTRAIFRSMYEHNAINLSGVGDLTKDSMENYGLRTLIIARQEGLCADGMVNGSSFDGTYPFVWSPTGPLWDPEDHTNEYRIATEKFRKTITDGNAVMDKYLGHHRCYYSSCDECGPGTNRRAFGFWNILHELGGYTWIDYGDAFQNGPFTEMNDVPAHIGAKVAMDWQASGAKAVTYASSFSGPENPDVWRRIKGIRFWFADFDGQHEYCFFDGRANRWNDFVRYDRYCQFGIVYWTIDGLVSTLAWEAEREAIDDVRYYSLLRLRAEAALRSKDPQVRRLGRDALVWQDGVDTEYVLDLDAYRRETAAWIKRLIAKVGPEPAERDTELPPPAVLPPDPRWEKVPKPSAGAKAVFAYADKAGYRYDLAIAALQPLFDDEKTATTDRFKAAMRLSSMHSEMLERDAAVAILERALRIKSLKSGERAKLLLKRVDVMMTNAKFEERYTVAQLDTAASAIAEALTFSGGGEEARSAAIYRLSRAYMFAKAYEKAIAYAKARLEDTKLSARHQMQLNVLIGEAYNYLEKWEDAMNAFREAHRVYNSDKDAGFRRLILPFEAVAAEQLKDYDRAVYCWTELIPTYSKEELDQKKIAVRNVQRLSTLAQRNRKITVGSLDDDDESDPISLDE